MDLFQSFITAMQLELRTSNPYQGKHELLHHIVTVMALVRYAEQHSLNAEILYESQTSNRILASIDCDGHVYYADEFGYYSQPPISTVNKRELFLQNAIAFNNWEESIATSVELMCKYRGLTTDEVDFLYHDAVMTQLSIIYSDPVQIPGNATIH